jgi:hypothetical protein
MIILIFAVHPWPRPPALQSAAAHLQSGALAPAE